MNVSTFLIGTELSKGIIQDKHTLFINSKLNTLGYNIKRSEIIPDDGSIGEEIKHSLSDSDVIILTGGLGPTSDDITREVIAKLAGVPLERNQAVWDCLYGKIGERIHGANEVQTLFPKGFEILENPNGTAPGFMGFVERGNKETAGKTLIVCMPGPPREMQPMFMNFVVPKLSDYIGGSKISTDEYSVFLIAEARLEDLCKKVQQDNSLSGVSWGTRFQDYKISLYINGEDAAERAVFIEKLRELAGNDLIADGCIEAVDILVNDLVAKNYKIATAESATSGLLAKLLTDKAGSSAWYWGGVNSYSADAKIKILSVNADNIKKYGMVTTDCATEMAEGILSVSGADIAVSITGIAGPSGAEEGKPNGTVCLGFASKNAASQAVMVKTFWHSRESSRRRFAVLSLVLAEKYLNGASLIDICSAWNYI